MDPENIARFGAGTAMVLAAASFVVERLDFATRLLSASRLAGELLRNGPLPRGRDD
jgi:hypothetical protein